MTVSSALSSALSPALAQALAAARPALNARVAAARRAQPGYDVAALAQVVRERVDPLAAAVAAVAPDRVGAVVAAAFDIAVLLVGQRLIGPQARNGFVDRLWTDVLPDLAAIVAERPVAVLGRLTNAVIRLAATPGARVEEWLSLMRALAPLAGADSLPAIGQVLAWRAGMAHYREGALRVADTLPEPVALAATGAAGGDWGTVRAAFAANRWWSPAGGAEGIAFGGFTGHGGPFAEPPTVAATAGGFLVRAGDRHGLLVADAFGAMLHPATAGEYAEAESAARPVVGRPVQAGDRAIAVDLPLDGLVAVANADSVAIASPYSHFVVVHPWRLP